MPRIEPSLLRVLIDLERGLRELGVPFGMVGALVPELLRYAVEHEGRGVPYEYTCAYLLGTDAREFLDEPLTRAVAGVLDRFTDEDAEVVGIVARADSSYQRRTPSGQHPAALPVVSARETALT